MNLTRTEVNLVVDKIFSQHKEDLAAERKAIKPTAAQIERAKTAINALSKVPKWYVDTYVSEYNREYFRKSAKDLALIIAKKEFKSKIKDLRSREDIIIDVALLSKKFTSIEEILNKVKLYK